MVIVSIYVSADIDFPIKVFGVTMNDIMVAVFGRDTVLLDNLLMIFISLLIFFFAW